MNKVKKYINELTRNGDNIAQEESETKGEVTFEENSIEDVDDIGF